jgi:hypothetical protein
LGYFRIKNETSSSLDSLEYVLPFGKLNLTLPSWYEAQFPRVDSQTWTLFPSVSRWINSGIGPRSRGSAWSSTVRLTCKVGLGYEKHEPASPLYCCTGSTVITLALAGRENQTCFWILDFGFRPSDRSPPSKSLSLQNSERGTAGIPNSKHPALLPYSALGVGVASR